MAGENAGQLCRSRSLPGRSPPAISPEYSPRSTISRPPPPIPAEAPPSSITRPYRLSSPSSSTSSFKGFVDLSSTGPSFLQRRVYAKQGRSEVKASPVEDDPPPAPAPPPPPRPPPAPPFSRSTSSSAYEVLQVSPKASHHEIKSSYKRLVRQHHPDKVHSDHMKEASNDLFLQIHAAYLALKDPDARAQHDHEMSVQSAQSASIAVQTPHFCRPSPNVFTPRSQPQTPKATATATPNSYMPWNQFYMTSKGASVGSVASNASTPRTPARSWETDQCW